MPPQKKTLKKIILLGSEKSGKTSVMNKWVQGTFRETYKATIGADFVAKEMTMNTQVQLQLWDTSGAERFQSLGVAFYRGADGVVFVVDITKVDKELDDVLANWAPSFLKNAGNSKPVPAALVFNKCDLEYNISREDMEKACEKIESLGFSSCMTFKKSAKEDSSSDFDEVFELFGDDNEEDIALVKEGKGSPATCRQGKKLIASDCSSDYSSSCSDSDNEEREALLVSKKKSTRTQKLIDSDSDDYNRKKKKKKKSGTKYNFFGFPK